MNEIKKGKYIKLFYLKMTDQTHGLNLKKIDFLKMPYIKLLKKTTR